MTQACTCEPGEAAQLGVLGQSTVDLCVEARDEHGGHRVDRRDVVAVRVRGGETGDVGLRDLAVAVGGEDERDVDVDAFCKHPADRRKALEGRRDLDHHVRAVDRGCQFECLGDGGLGVVREPRIDLERDATIDAT